MKLNRLPNPHQGKGDVEHCAAFALVLILICLALLAVVVVGLLSTMQSERATTGEFMAGTRTRHLAQAALELVQAQIRLATTEGINEDGQGTQTWASQPGMIRRYDAEGNLVGVHKLYSASNMTATAADTSMDLPEKWFERPEEFVDLNEPVRLRESRRMYPILNPEMPAGFQPSGFSLGSAPGESPNPAAMPVRWIYLRENGTFDTNPVADSNNPAVGRIAFWADDESSKVNINTATASDGNTWWDIPRTAGRPERIAFSERQPTAFEYQRYPGHPATVNLTAALGGFSTLGEMQQWFSAFPRYAWGGSRNGSVITSGSAAGVIPPLPLDTNRRLYASVHEFLFSDELDGGSRDPNAMASPAQLGFADFFLTAASRAPDLNLFGQPRVLLWPVDTDPAKRTLFDEFIALCGTVGDTPYYFERMDALSPTTDIALPHNLRVRGYLSDLFARNLPGFPGSIQGKFTAARVPQLLTSVFDYIRSVNLNETYPGAVAEGRPSFTPNQTRFEGAATTEQAAFRGAGFVIPSQWNNTRGMGRMPVISEAGLWMIAVQNDASDVVGENLLQVALLLETFSPMQGYMTWQPNYDIVLTESSLQIQGSADAGVQPVMNALPRVYSSWFSPLNASYGQSVGGTDGFGYLINANASGTPDTGVAKIPSYQFFSPSLLVTGEEITVSGTLKFELRNPAGTVLQTYNFSFPEFRVSRPGKFYPSTVARPDRRHHWQSRVTTRPATVGVHTAISNVVPLLNFRAEDVVRSIQLSHGDYRLVSLQTNVGPDDYVPILPDYEDAGQRLVHSFRFGWNQYLRGARMGSYVPGSYFEISDEGFGVSSRPDILPGITALRPTYAGDFDNGIGYSVDGPFFNKPDEGARTQQGEPYFNPLWRRKEGLFCPSRQIPSAGLFGSIPRGTRPWETLLFCPNPAAGGSHPGKATASQPADWVLLDFFNMPVTLPYAISEPFSTAGRVNINSAIAPFHYITRSTALHAVLSGIGLSAIPRTAAAVYKRFDSTTTNTFDPRVALDIAKTVSGFESRFFRSPAEICDVFLVPAGETLSNTQNLISGFWSDKELTGDNTRERPYAVLYPLLTTKSNTYNLHFRVQALNQQSGRNVVTAEYRGSYLLERFIDPADPRLIAGNPGYLDAGTQSLEPLYQYRVLERRQFNPR
jgi:hypothetical protein